LPAPFFTSNPAEYGQLEGLYITEQKPPAGVAGVDLAAGIVGGQTIRGPVDTPVEITSFARFVEVFGGRDQGSGGSLANEVWEFLLNKPFGKVVVVRACASAAVKASFTLESNANGTGGTAIVRVDASSPGIWGNNVGIKVESATDGTVGKFNLRVRYLGATKLYENLDLRTGTDNSAPVLGDDLGNWITLTKLADGTPVTTGMAGLDSDGYVLLGQTVANFTSVAGADGTIADSDYTGSNRVIDLLASYKGVGWAAIAKRANSTLNAALKTKAALATDRVFLIWNGTLGASNATAISDVASYRADRVVYCWNSPYTIDPETAQQIQVPAHSWMASIMSQTAPEQHVGSFDTKKWTSGITKLTYESLTRDDYKSLRAAGISALERDEDGGFLFVSGVTTDLTQGKTEIARRRQADYIQLSLAKASKPYVKQPNGPDNELLALVGGLYVDFLAGLQSQGRIVKDFAVRFDNTVNPENQLSQGIGVIQVDVDLIEHILSLVVRTQIGTGVTTSQDAA
jgi:hypothetical protein